MKIVFLTIFLILQCFFVAFSQKGENFSQGEFLKRVEYNLSPFENVYNFDCKDETEKMFFGDLNAPVEFFIFHAFGGTSCFRILKNTDKPTYTLEVKYSYNPNRIPILAPSDTLKIIPVSIQFAELLYRKMVFFIDNIKAVRDFPHIDGVLDPDANIKVERRIFDGEGVTFRTVVEDEVWSLKIRTPAGNARKLTDICKQIIEDVKDKKLDEENYIKLLDEF